MNTPHHIEHPSDSSRYEQAYYYQIRDQLWQERKEELQSVFHREQIYHMSLDLAELFMKRYLPRIRLSGTKYHGRRR